MEWQFTRSARERYEQLPGSYREALTERLDRAVRYLRPDDAYFQLVVNDLEVSGRIVLGRLILDKVSVRPRGFEPP